MTNQEAIEKATITTDAIAAAGKLNPEQSDRFIDYVVDETSMGDRVRVVRFRNEQKLIEKINVANRVAVPKEEATDPRVRRGVSTSKVTLDHHEIMVPFEIGDLFVDENIEGDNIEDHIVQMMARRLANNIEEVWWDGNTVGPAALESEMVEGGSSSLYVKDSYLAMFDGWLKLAEAGHVIEAAGATFGPNLLSRAVNAMPRKFRKNKAALKWLIASDYEQVYREQISGRGTMEGDKALFATGNLPAYGIEMVPVALLSDQPTYVEDSVANNDGTSTTALSYGPITELVLTVQNLGDTPLAKYILATDYTVDETNGTWIRLGAGAIGAGATVKATYLTGGRVLLTNPMNLIACIGRDIRIEKQRNIFKGVNEYAITAKVGCNIEETDAVVLIKNVAPPA